MSMPFIRQEVASFLQEVDEKIADAEKKHEKGALTQKVNAAGELAFLRHQKEMLEERLKEIDAHPEQAETLMQWLKEDWFNLKLRIDTWVGGK
ncbi:hypothetical protein [Phenylobacterium sp.]|uniref:hypothetical protein n=1 Tax=Phenylobacterium sp. TaxID=1871053 RepID=UPI0035B45D1C